MKCLSIKKGKLEQLKDFGRWRTRIKIAEQTKNEGNTELHSLIQNKTINGSSPNFASNIKRIQVNNLTSIAPE